jgi:polyisoprenoid-binding protein YceI
MTTILTSKFYLGLCLSFLFFLTGVSNAQIFEIIPQSALVSIHGTSSVHDWDMKVTKVNSEFGINASKQITTLSVKIPITSIKSGKGIMDGKTYDAFDAKKNPNIVFQLTEASSTKWSDKETEITVTGNLSMAGETRKISFKTLAKITKTGDYELKGTVPLKMTDYGMIPPTAFFGTMKTGDAVSIKFDVTFKG